MCYVRYNVMAANEIRKNKSTETFKGKRVLVMGLGLHGGGIDTVKFLMRERAQVIVTDLRSRHALASSLKALAHFSDITYILGCHRKNDFADADYIIKNPGVKPDSPYLAYARKRNIPIINDIGIFLERAPCRIIGVTGTRGKSTTAHLIAAFLKTKYPRVLLGGNIRTSVLSFMHRVRKDDIVVLELSSFQLQDIAAMHISPTIAVLTNLMPDHLNWHGSRRNYFEAKRVIFRFQRPHDMLFANPEDKEVVRLAKTAPGRVAFPRLNPSFYPIVDRNIGSHYRESIGLAISVAAHLGVKKQAVTGVLARFRGLEGRQEIVRIIRGITFINDTTATMPEATIAALNRFSTIKGVGNRIILIAGGQDKELSYHALAVACAAKAKILILLPGSATDKLVRALSGRIRSRMLHAKNMKQAVQSAWRNAQKRDVVLLSPGAASFGLFENEFDRGRQFVYTVHALK